MYSTQIEPKDIILVLIWGIPSVCLAFPLVCIELVYLTVPQELQFTSSFVITVIQYLQCHIQVGQIGCGTFLIIS